MVTYGILIPQLVVIYIPARTIAAPASGLAAHCVSAWVELNWSAWEGDGLIEVTQHPSLSRQRVVPPTASGPVLDVISDDFRMIFRIDSDDFRMIFGSIRIILLVSGSGAGLAPVRLRPNILLLRLITRST